MTVDVGFYISRYYSQQESTEWWPSYNDYDPGFSKEDWLKLLNDPEIIGPVWGNSLAEFYDIGGAATCTQVGQKYGRDPASVSGNITNLSKHIHKKTKCPLFEKGDGRQRYWTIMFQGKTAESDQPGSWVWKLRPELSEALSEFDILRFLKTKDEKEFTSDEECNYWWLNANPKIWSFSDIAVGEEQSYSLYNENGNKRKVFKNFLEAKPGDKVIGYEANPVKQVVALAQILGDAHFIAVHLGAVHGLGQIAHIVQIPAKRRIAHADTLSEAGFSSCFFTFGT